MMARSEVFDSISGEREYQDLQTPLQPNMLKDFHMGDAIAAIEHNLDLARREWYRTAAPYRSTMEYLRKVAAIIVKMGEEHGMPERSKEVWSQE